MIMPTPEVESVEPLHPLQVLSLLGLGRFPQEFADAIARVGTDVIATGRPGGVTVTLKISPAGSQTGDPMVVVEDEVKVKLPSKKPMGNYLHVLDGEIWRDDPRQTVMDLRTVDHTSGEVRTVTDKTPDVRELPR
jgi:hypothetical protein